MPCGFDSRSVETATPTAPTAGRHAVDTDAALAAARGVVTRKLPLASGMDPSRLPVDESQPVAPPEEGTELLWLSPAEAEARLVHPSQAWVVRHYWPR